MALVRALVIIFLLLVGISTGMELYVTGNVTGTGDHNLSIIAPGCNVTGNNSSWLVVWEDNARIPICCA
jgi:hypothetical protein